MMIQFLQVMFFSSYKQKNPYSMGKYNNSKSKLLRSKIKDDDQKNSVAFLLQIG